MATFGEALESHLGAMRVSQSDLAAELTRRGVPTTRAVVNTWVRNKARPEPWKWSTLLDSLGVSFVERRNWEALLQARTPERHRRRHRTPIESHDDPPPSTSPVEV